MRSAISSIDRVRGHAGSRSIIAFTSPAVPSDPVSVCLALVDGQDRTAWFTPGPVRREAVDGPEPPTTFDECPWQESNLRTSLRRRMLYPLSYRGGPGRSIRYRPPVARIVLPTADGGDVAPVLSRRAGRHARAAACPPARTVKVHQ